MERRCCYAAGIDFEPDLSKVASFANFRQGE